MDCPGTCSGRAAEEKGGKNTYLIWKTILSNIFIMSVLIWAFRVHWNKKILTTEWTLRHCKREWTVNEDNGEVVEMFCKERDGRVQLTLWVARAALKTDACICQEVWVSLRICSLAACLWWVMFSKMMLTTMAVIMITMKGDNAGEKKRIKPDFAQFYTRPPFLCLCGKIAWPLNVG